MPLFFSFFHLDAFRFLRFAFRVLRLCLLPCFYLFFFLSAPTMFAIQAEKLLQEMLEAGLTPNVITYTSLMVVLRRGDQFEKAVGILDLMRSKVRWKRY